MPPRKPRRRLRGTGSIENLPSGRYRARYAGSSETFDSELAADRWLVQRRHDAEEEKINPSRPRDAGRTVSEVVTE